MSIRLNKEPPDDAPVVEFVGVGEPNASASVRPLDHITQNESASRGSESDRGAGGLQPDIMTAEEERDEDLEKIKNSGSLSEDDNCIICLSGESCRPGNPPFCEGVLMTSTGFNFVP